MNVFEIFDKKRAPYIITLLAQIAKVKLVCVHIISVSCYLQHLSSFIFSVNHFHKN